MAGDWIKFEINTPDKPEVWAIASSLNIDPDAVVGKLLRVWSWFDSHTENGNAPSVTRLLLDRMVGVTGFCDEVIKAGWLNDDGETLQVSNFDRHNGKSAKKRAVTNRRVTKVREKQRLDGYKCNAESVTKSVTREEKRREENKEKDKKESWKLPSWVNAVAWTDFEQHRKEIRKPLSDLARTKAANQLQNLTKEQQQQCVDMTIQNHWQGLFPEKVSNEAGKSISGRNNQSGQSNAQRMWDNIGPGLRQPDFESGEEPVSS